MDKAKALDKIQKCLRLSQSSNANEAAAALRQAQKMMEQYQISLAEVELAAYGCEEVDVPIQMNKKTPIALQMLLTLIEKAFGVRPVISSRIGVSDRSYRIKYFGPTTRVQMAGYAHQVIYRAMETAWREHLKANPLLRGHRGARASFQVGWLQEVKSKVAEIGFPEEEKAATQALMNQTYGKALTASKTNNQGLYGSLMGEGRRAAGDFNISRPMGTEKNRLGHG